MKRIGLYLGIALFAVFLATSPPQDLSQAAWRTAGIGLLMATWWATEAVPVPITSLLPIAFFPVLGLGTLSEATSPYAHPVIYLLFGGFIIATAIERWDLHRRIALNILILVGDQSRAIVGGFMAATAMLSMWISNTATTIMMIPIALSLATLLSNDEDIASGDSRSFRLCLCLGIAYSASIGGLGTLIGTPPNAMFSAYMTEAYGIEIGFLRWMMLAVPVVLVLVPAGWWVLTHLVYPFQISGASNSSSLIRAELDKLGPISTPQMRTLLVLIAAALAWVTRPLLQKVWFLSDISDTSIAIIGAISLFLIPAGDPETRNTKLLDWRTAERIPWGVLVLFGGGLSLATSVNSSGLADWLGLAIAALSSLHLFVFVLAVVTLVIFLTEITSNTATTATLLPVMGGLAAAAQVDPLLLAVPMTMAASCAFMLPVATAPNAIVFATGEVSIAEMAKAGFWVNVAATAIICSIAYFLVPIVLLA